MILFSLLLLTFTLVWWWARWYGRSLRAQRRVRERRPNPDPRPELEWEPYRFNSGFYYHGALGRAGWHRTGRPGVIFPETDQAYYDALPEWLRRSEALRCPPGVVRSVTARGAL